MPDPSYLSHPNNDSPKWKGEGLHRHRLEEKSTGFQIRRTLSPTLSGMLFVSLNQDCIWSDRSYCKHKRIFKDRILGLEPGCALLSKEK
jgi:hypothetical protein